MQLNDFSPFDFAALWELPPIVPWKYHNVPMNGFYAIPQSITPKTMPRILFSNHSIVFPKQLFFWGGHGPTWHSSMMRTVHFSGHLSCHAYPSCHAPPAMYTPFLPHMPQHRTVPCYVGLYHTCPPCHACPGMHAPCHTCPPATHAPLWTESQTHVKTKPWSNYVADGKKMVAEGGRIHMFLGPLSGRWICYWLNYHLVPNWNAHLVTFAVKKMVHVKMGLTSTTLRSLTKWPKSSSMNTFICVLYKDQSFPKINLSMNEWKIIKN